MNKWRDIWSNRRPEGESNSLLLRLLREDGYDTLGAITEDAWRGYVSRLRGCLRLQSSDSVFDVGCGAGALLWCFREAGHLVGGIDYSPQQIALARHCMPDANDFHNEEADQLDPHPPYQAVVASGTFLYFPDYAYAALVIRRMAQKSSRCLALLDLPDLAKKPEILRARMEALGSEKYHHRYEGLEHLYFSRDWVRAELESLGLTCAIEDQKLEGYSHAAYRFNVFAWK